MIIGSTLAGLAGATLLIQNGIFQENLTQAQGFIAVALVYFGAWRPCGVMAGALLYGLTEAVVLSWKGLGIIPLSGSDLAGDRAGGDHRARPAHGRAALPAAGGARQALRARRLTVRLPHSRTCDQSRRGLNRRSAAAQHSHTSTDLRVRSRRTRMRTSYPGALLAVPRLVCAHSRSGALAGGGGTDRTPRHRR